MPFPSAQLALALLFSFVLGVNILIASESAIENASKRRLTSPSSMKTATTAHACMVFLCVCGTPLEFAPALHFLRTLSRFDQHKTEEFDL